MYGKKLAAASRLVGVVTGQEGYVAIDQKGTSAVKLVDRLDFSYANFSKDVIKGWESDTRN
jgi:hypothetical protein